MNEGFQISNPFHRFLQVMTILLAFSNLEFRTHHVIQRWKPSKNTVPPRHPKFFHPSGVVISFHLLTYWEILPRWSYSRAVFVFFFFQKIRKRNWELQSYCRKKLFFLLLRNNCRSTFKVAKVLLMKKEISIYVFFFYFFCNIKKKWQEYWRVRFLLKAIISENYSLTGYFSNFVNF